MPSQGHGVQEFMNLTTVESPSFQDLYKKSGGDSYSPSFHQYTKDTAKIFATFIFSDEMVPVGDAQDKCLYLELAPVSDKNNQAAFKPLEEMPDCSRSKEGWWNFHDPTIGIDIPTWFQNEIYLECSGTACGDTCTKKHGWWVWKNDKVEGTCYTYDVLTEICVVVTKYVDAFGKVHWKYTGGCFDNNLPGLYVEGKPKTTYNFESVPISVRANNDPFVTMNQGATGAKEHGNRALGTISLLLFIIALGTGIGGAVYYKKLGPSFEAFP